MTAKSEAEKDELPLRLDAVEYLATSRSFRAGSFLDQSIRVGTAQPMGVDRTKAPSSP
jgi:hypothetical protein